MLRRLADAEGREHWVWSDADGQRDLSLAGLGPSLAEAAAWLQRKPAARAASLAQAPKLPETSAARVCLPGRPGKILALGRNFAAHAAEMGARPSLDDMLWFAKFPESCIPPDAPLPVPAWLAGRVDPEAELVLVLGRPLHGATEAEAEAAIAGYTLGNDFTARGLQAEDKQKAWPWVRSKNLVGFGSYGPGWLPADALPQSAWAGLRLQGLVNGELRQEGGLDQMLYPPARALAELSRWIPLAAGDLLFLGTPAGVAGLADGDQCTVRVVDAAGATPLGTLEHSIQRPEQAGPPA